MTDYKYPEAEGVFEMPDDEYHALEAASNSGLRHIRRSPAHYRWAKDNPNDPTPAMRDGTAIHMAILEPERFLRTYVAAPDNAPPRPSKRQLEAKNPSEATIQAIQYWDMFDKQYGGANVISREKLEQYQNAAQSVRSHRAIAGLLSHGASEQSIFARDPQTKVWCKCRPDWLTTKGGYNVMLELKTTADAQDWAFQRTAYTLRYFEAAAFYMDVMEWSGVGRPDLYLIAVLEKDPPYAVRLFEIPEQDILIARDSYRVDLNRYAQCLEADIWPGYDQEISQLTHPAWASTPPTGEDNAD